MLTAALVLQLALAQADTAPITALRTARPFALFVSPAGNDKRTCRLASQPCRTPNAAVLRIPHGVDHRVRLVVGAGVYDAGLGVLADHEFGAADPENPGQVVIECEQRAAVLDGGSAGGTFSAVSNGSGATWASYTDGSQTWVPSAMVDGGTVSGGAEGSGYWLALTSGPGSDGGMRLPVSDNTGTVLQVPGQFPVGPTTSTGYQLQEPAAVFMGTAGTVQTPGSITGTNLRGNFPAQLILRNNRAGYDSNLTSGTVDGGSWAPIIVQGCRFRGDSSATMAGIATDGPVAVLESRFDGFGANGRLIVPTSTHAALVASRNSVDSAGARLVSFARVGTLWDHATVEQNVIVNLEYVVFGSNFPNGFLSHNNLFQTVSTTGGGGAVYRLTETGDGYSFGDRVIRAPVYLRYPGGSYEQAGGRGQFHIDGVTASNISLAFISAAGRGGLNITVNTGNGPYGAAAASVQVSSGARFIIAGGNGTDVRWRASNTTITEDPASVTLGSSLLFADNISGYPIATVNTLTPHEVCNVRGTCMGWLDDLNVPFSPVVGWVGTGAGGQALAVEPFSGSTSGGGTLAISFSPSFRDVPWCTADYAANPGALANPLWQAATDGGVTWTGAASTAVRGFCLGPR